jgi:hypothetical protein
MQSVLIDTGVWYAFFDLKDNIKDRETVDALAEIVESMNVLIPWPILYETIKIDHFATFNDADFIDIRTVRNISLLPG